MEQLRTCLFLQLSSLHRSVGAFVASLGVCGAAIAESTGLPLGTCRVRVGVYDIAKVEHSKF